MTIAILAYGSLIDDPQEEIAHLEVERRAGIRTPFRVEFARSSRTRDGAPTLVPVEEGGAYVEAILIILREGTDLGRAQDVLYRREIHCVGDETRCYVPKPAKTNQVDIKVLRKWQGIDYVLYTRIASNIAPLTAEKLAELAIKSAKESAGKDRNDGITYLLKTKRSRIKTVLSDQYEALVLDMTGARNLEEAWEKCRSVAPQAVTSSSITMRLGIDVGGTFTDLVLIDDDSGTIHYTKTPTTPGDLVQGVLAGIEQLLAQAHASMDQVAYLAHGTTIGTNALIERRGARVGLITTTGFRDVLEIARVERPDGGLYDMNVDLPAPLVPRYLRLEVAERVGADGAVVTPLDQASVRSAVEQLRAAGVAAIAVCLLFSFRNPAHEQAVRDLCAELCPDLPVSLSCEVAPEFREYERTSTTVINAYLTPVIERYLDDLSRELAARYGATDLRIMQASGGVMPAAVARSHAVNLVNSGPAGGALATALCGRLAGEERLVGIDMGGTSFDIGLVIDGQPRVRPEGEFEGYPVKIPLIDVEGLGAGGGSIAWVDAGGALNVGPQSAGADPGPACYGRGGTRPTVTDANLVLGRLNPDYFLGAEMRLHPDRAREAIATHVVAPLAEAGTDFTVEQAAAGIIRVVNANMVRGIGVNVTQKGYDLREFAMLAFGGAGPLHAAELASEIGLRRVLVPPFCAVFSAFGAVASDVRHDYVRTVALAQASDTAARLRDAFAALEEEARAQLAAERVAPDDTVIERAVDLRYTGQSYELTVPLRSAGELTDDALARLVADFHDLHRRIYAYGDPSEAVEFVSVRMAGIGRVPDVNLRREDTVSGMPTPRAQREVHFPATGFVPAAIYRRNDLHPGHAFVGPGLIEERTSTTVVPPGVAVQVDGLGNLVLELPEAAA